MITMNLPQKGMTPSLIGYSRDVESPFVEFTFFDPDIVWTWDGSTWIRHDQFAEMQVGTFGTGVVGDSQLAATFEFVGKTDDGRQLVKIVHVNPHLGDLLSVGDEAIFSTTFNTVLFRIQV